MRPEHLGVHLRRLVEAGYSSLQIVRMAARFERGAHHYGEWNHHRPDFRPYAEVLEELDDAGNLTTMVADRYALTPQQQDLHDRMVGAVREAADLCEQLIIAVEEAHNGQAADDLAGAEC
ncbi:MAG: hypothetical protein AB7Y46_08730 [Armatimonadota bacterium]